ncbi:hypothetical protein [Streptomyces sp. cg2]|uniref:hypothetical protein n=1 Tax=Streptomyces sp. cg2 TaxID=3238799 RepID=UPI0034E1DF87
MPHEAHASKSPTAAELTATVDGPMDDLCNLHGPKERVLLSELRGALLAEPLFLAEFAAAHRPGGVA